jgi:hypothetical protein
MGANPNLCTTRMTLLAAGLTVGVITAAAAGSLGGPLELQDEGVFFVNGQAAATAFPDSPPTGAAPPGQIMIDQMYVQYRIPKNVSAPPIVMVHGSGHTGVTYETTPDGREGWAIYFARKNFPVYVIDHVGRGRSGFDPTPINQARRVSNPALLPSVPLFTRERAFANFRPAIPDALPSTSFKVTPSTMGRIGEEDQGAQDLPSLRISPRVSSKRRPSFEPTGRLRLAMSALLETNVSDPANPIQQPEIDATRTTARLPGLDIEIVHSRSPSGDAEQPR